ncbi:LuxR C-terminal-related transcriptional regulator [Silvibacterium dinghuense]|nr:response regulator transcription factor [Silvibacterium dinghuense]
MSTNAPEEGALRIGLLDFEPIRIAGLEDVLGELPHLQAVPTTLEVAMEDESLPLILVGLRDPLDSFETLARLKARRPAVKLILMGAEANEETIISAIAAGAKGYLEETVTPAQVTHCIEVVQSGSIWAPRKVLSKFVDRMLHTTEKRVLRHHFTFTEREQEVLRLLVAARSNREIAQSLGIEERTVKAYVGRLMRKVGVQNRIALSIHAASRVFGLEE